MEALKNRKTWLGTQNNFITLGKLFSTYLSSKILFKDIYLSDITK